MDPLSNYGYSYPNYNQLPNNGYGYDVKIEGCNQNIINNPQSVVPNPYNMGTYPLPYQTNIKPALELENSVTDPQTTQINNNHTNNSQQQTQNEKTEEEIDTKEGIPLLPQHRKRGQKKKGKTSNYWNKKIDDKNFPFYGCTICNISFNTIQQLDEHVTIHKGRLTSYDIRLRNKLKRKEKIKQMKKNKKLGKLGKLGKKTKDIVKQENNFILEIKPEDGYIGNEIASEFNNSENQDIVNQNTQVNESNPNHASDDKSSESKNIADICDSKDVTVDKCDIKDATDDKSDIKANVSKLKIPEPEDPRLLKLFKCFACQKQFSLSYYLRLHVRSHTDEKPYTCAECGQSFITASKLGRHNKRIHLAIRFQCRICYRFFSRFDILTRHFDKAHAADKIEGEPYDFNAILPYLKELEEQLRDQAEASAAQAGAAKTEPWGDSATHNIPNKDSKDAKDNKDLLDSKDHLDPSFVLDTKPGLDPKYEDDTKDNIVDENLISIYTSHTEQAYVKCDDDALLDSGVKVELEEPPSPLDDAARDDCNSDEDYFPSNTWAMPPSPPPPAPAAPPSPPAPRAPPRARARNKKHFPMQCELCDKTINSNSYYKVHLRTHSGERPFKCYVCSRGFITSSKMHRHVLTHHELEGDENGEQKVKEELKQQIKAEEEEENVAKGKKKKKKGAKGIKKEGIKKYRKRPHACPFCNKRFLHLDTLNVHKKSHDGETLILRCNFCLEEQADEATLADHEQTHKPPRPFLCTICERTYTKKETMIYHRKTHSEGGGGGGKKNFICDICSKSFNAQCKLLRHIVSHKTEKVVLRYECPVCAHLFHTKYHVNMHLASHQKEGLILEANRHEILAMVLQNARKMTSKPDAPLAPLAPLPADAPPAPALDLPPPAPGDDERSRVCNICGQIFQHFYYLEEHLKTHASAIAIEAETKKEQNKHVCPVCNKGFKLHYYLKLHSFTHSKERPFVCQQCGKGFITKGKLKRHMETHSGLKKYQCHICYKFFTRPSYLRIHVRTIHGTQDFNFRINKQYSIEPGDV